ncbi:MAG: anhydro-N-acetylmuramic acid kinase [Alphaproteobacteria bacterium]|nr:anhydro-N-acetylmuramic acid kinase [Alphaproteobacteria bacterium]
MTAKYPAKWVIGLMSGTSLDGVDAALIKTDGQKILEFGAYITVPFEPALYEQLHDAVHMRGDIMKIEHELTIFHALAVKSLLTKANMHADDVHVIGFHGQTVTHRPKEGITWQIGNGAQLAALTKINVVCDFRRRDVAAGGQGAPLVPLYHAALARTLQLPVAVVNIGGIGNVTWVGKSEERGESIMSHDILAFDTGPGNAMLNDWVRKHTGEAYDKDGEMAQNGKVYDNIIAEFMKHPYFSATPPKSLDRNDFNITQLKNLTAEDGAATLTQFTATTIARAVEYFPALPKLWLVSGGGRHNPAMMKALSSVLPLVKPVESVGWDGDALEAQAFGFLAMRSLHNLPLSLPTTTGASHAVTGGAFYRAGYYGTS